MPGSYNSALVKKPAGDPPAPPVTRTFPLDSNVAVCSARGVVMLPVQTKVPGPWATVTVAIALLVESAWLVATTWKTHAVFGAV